MRKGAGEKVRKGEDGLGGRGEREQVSEEEEKG